MANTTNYYFNKPTVGGSQNSWGGDLNENWDKVDRLLYGASFTDSESNTVEKIQPDLNKDNWAINGTAVTTSAEELNKLDGATVTTSQLNVLGALTSTAAELNKLDGCTTSTTELNYVTGVTSALQTQLNSKAALAGPTFTGTTTTSDLNVSANASVAGEVKLTSGAQDWSIEVDSSNNLVIKYNNATVFKLSTAGILQTPNDIQAFVSF